MVLWHTHTLPVEEYWRFESLLPRWWPFPVAKDTCLESDFAPESLVGDGSHMQNNKQLPVNGVYSVNGSEQRVIHCSSCPLTSSLALEMRLILVLLTLISSHSFGSVSRAVTDLGTIPHRNTVLPFVKPESGISVSEWVRSSVATGTWPVARCETLSNVSSAALLFYYRRSNRHMESLDSPRLQPALP